METLEQLLYLTNFISPIWVLIIFFAFVIAEIVIRFIPTPIKISPLHILTVILDFLVPDKVTGEEKTEKFRLKGLFKKKPANG